MPSAALHFFEDSSGRLVVIDPPFYLLGWLFLGLGMVFIGFAFVGKLLSRRAPIIWVALIPGVPFFLAGLLLSFSQTTITLSRPAETIVIATSRVRVMVGYRQLRLDSVRRALVETDGTSKRLCIQLQSGEVVPTSEQFTDRDGYYEAAEAINRFLRTARSTPE